MVRLVVKGTLLLDGGIVCRGAPDGYHGGGGSGGSIYLTVGTLAGVGAISADGGDGGEGGGGGGGGRIAVYYDTATFSGTVTASGGAGVNLGGIGTIFLSMLPEDYLEAAITELHGLAAANFTNAQSGNALTNKLEATIALIEAGLYQDALMKLQHDLLPKMDGCALTGRPDKGDWIIPCEAQQKVYVLVWETIQILQSLI